MSYIAKNGRLYTSGASEALTLLDDKFSVNKSYSKGDSCIYNDYLWKFTSDKPAGEWDSSVVEQCRIMDIVDDVNGRLTQVQTQIVPTASIESGAFASKAYSVGDFLVKNGSLWKAAMDISKDDALTPANIVPTTVGGELSSIKSSLSNKSFEEIATATKEGNVTTTKPLSEFNGFIFMLHVSDNSTYPNIILPTTFVTREIFEIDKLHLFVSNETGSHMGRVKRVDDNTVNFFYFKSVKKAYLFGFY